MSEESEMGTGSGDDVIGRRRIFANVDRARAFGANSFSGVLDTVGGLMVLGSIVAVVVMAATDGAVERSHAWLDEFLVLIVGVTGGFLLMALSRLVLYGKACAVLLARITEERAS